MRKLRCSLKRNASMGVYKLTIQLQRAVSRPFCPGTEGRTAPGRTDCGEESCRGVNMPSPPGESRAGGIHPGPVLWNLVNRILAPTFLLELGEWVQVAAEALLWGSQPRSGGHSPADLLPVTAARAEWLGGKGEGHCLRETSRRSTDWLRGHH